MLVYNVAVNCVNKYNSLLVFISSKQFVILLVMNNM